MRGRFESSLAIWIACIGIGLLFLVRGAFQNYMSPMFTTLGGFTFIQIAWLITAFGLAQTVISPVAGWYADRTSVHWALVTSIVAGCTAFLVIASGPVFAVSFIAVFVAGIAFTIGKISFNTILVLHSSSESLRRSVAKRATLLNLGSFFGNSLAQYTTGFGYSTHAVLLGLLYLPLSIGLIAKPSPSFLKPNRSLGWNKLKALCRQRSFLADALRRFAMTLPYGCWGTIIPIYVMDQYGGSITPIWTISLASLCTTVFGAHFLAVYLSGKLYSIGFKWEWWSMTSVFFYCAGLLLLVFSKNAVMLPIAVVVFICGEVLMTPCFDETAKKHGGESTMSTCIGLLQMVDGLGRWLGATFALLTYGFMQESTYSQWYWPFVVTSFLLTSIGLHVCCHFIGAAPSAEPIKLLPSAESESPA